MSYAVQQPAAVEVPHPRRPATVGFAAALLAVMGIGGLAYAVATLAVTPTVVNRFRGAAGSASSTDVDSLITVVWVGAAIAGVLAVILFALYVVLALGLRRGSNASRIGVWVLCGLGLLAGCGTTVTVLVQRSGTGTPGSLGVTLSDAYPGGWIGLNVALAIVQMVGYLAIAVLLVVSPGAFFGRGRAQVPGGPAYAGIPPYGAAPGSYGPGSPYGPPSGPGGPYGPGAAPGPYYPAGSPQAQAAPAASPYGPGVPGAAWQTGGYAPPPSSGWLAGDEGTSGYTPPPGSASPAGAGYAPSPGSAPPAGAGYASPPASGWPAGDESWPAGDESASSYGPRPDASPPGDEAVSGYAPSPDYTADAGSAANPPDPATPPPAAPPQPGPDDEYWSRPAG